MEKKVTSMDPAWVLNFSMALAISQSFFAVAIVAALLGIFLLLLLGTFVRARRASLRLAAAGERVAAPVTGRPGAPAPAAPALRPQVVVSRRDFFRGGLLASLGVFTAQFGGATLAFLWPNLVGGFGSLITLSDSPESVRSQIREGRQPYYYGPGRFYLVSYTGEGSGPGGPYEGLTAEGLMALYQKCVHLGCRVPFCQQSQWFECPCHGSKYSYAGEYKLGPAPRGMDRFPMILEDGQLKVDTSTIITGPPRGTDTIRQAPEGPFCV
ncbi:MAG: ubiquinol-cytochrome c reductase iron-sulfur subunit [Actinomycetota bacterium]